MTVLDRIGPVVRLVLFRPADPEGVALDLGDRLLSFVYEDSTKKLDKVTLELDNRDLAFLEDDNGLLGGGHLMVSWGYPGRMSTPRDVVIKRIRGLLKLTIEGVDLGSTLDRIQKTRTFEDATHSEIARRIASEIGYADEAQFIDDTEDRFEAVSQSAETDARLLRRLAALNGLEWWIDPLGFHWRAQDNTQAPAHVFTWFTDRQGTIQSISLDVDLLKQVGSSRSKSRDPETKTTNEYAAHSDNTERDSLALASQVSDPESLFVVDAESGSVHEEQLSGQTEVVYGNTSSEFAGPDPEMLGVSVAGAYTLGGVRPFSVAEYGLTASQILDKHRQAELATATVHPEPPMSAERNRKRAAERWKRAEREAVKLSASVVGDPTIEAKTIVEFRGLGSWLSGKYFVKQCTHKISASGYLCDLQCSGDGVNKAGAANQPKQTETTSGPETKDKGALQESGDGYSATGARLGDGDPVEAFVDPETGQIYTPGSTW